MLPTLQLPIFVKEKMFLADKYVKTKNNYHTIEHCRHAVRTSVSSSLTDFPMFTSSHLQANISSPDTSTTAISAAPHTCPGNASANASTREHPHLGSHLNHKTAMKLITYWCRPVQYCLKANPFLSVHQTQLGK